MAIQKLQDVFGVAIAIMDACHFFDLLLLYIFLIYFLDY
jgi:hypothetical protein